jgi:hypothetical protein
MSNIVRTSQRVLLVQTLDKQKGKYVSDSSGQATGRLRALYPGDTGPGFTSFLSNSERDGLITRRINGKRCYEISLNHKGDNFPDNYRDLISAEISVEETVPDIDPEPHEEPTEIAPEAATLDPEKIDYDLLALVCSKLPQKL